MAKKHKKTKKATSASISSARRKFFVFLYFAVGLLIIFCLALGFFLFYHKTPASIYVFPENPKQGDTVFVRVRNGSGNITGSLGDQKLIFYKKGNLGEWISFLGIDADQEPGDYKISVNASGKQLTKEIKVGLADFSSAPVAAAPSSAQTGVAQGKAIDNIIKNDNPVLKKILSNFTKDPYFSYPFSFPLKTMEKSGLSFGKFIKLAKYKIQHFGVDLKAPQKTEIYAVNDGKVVATINLSNYGKTVVIDHGLDIFSLCLHLDEFKVSEGQMVKRGQLIGLSGDTGYSTAPHLHFSIRVGSSRVDPVVFIETTQKINDNFLLADITNAFLNIIHSVK